MGERCRKFRRTATQCGVSGGAPPSTSIASAPPSASSPSSGAACALRFFPRPLSFSFSAAAAAAAAPPLTRGRSTFASRADSSTVSSSSLRSASFPSSRFTPCCAFFTSSVRPLAAAFISATCAQGGPQGVGSLSPSPHSPPRGSADGGGESSAARWGMPSRPRAPRRPRPWPPPSPPPGASPEPGSPP